MDKIKEGHAAVTHLCREVHELLF